LAPWPGAARGWRSGVRAFHNSEETFQLIGELAS
jgi:hypothetical protein